MEIPPSTSVAASPSVICRELGGETVLLDLRTGVYYGLDAVGTRVWQLLMEQKPIAAVCAAMLDEYDVDAAVLERDVSTLVRELCEKGLTTPREVS